MTLDKCFSNGKWNKNCQTVGDLKKEIQNLPDDLPLNDPDGEDGVDLVVFNRDYSNTHLGFTDGRDWDYDEEE